MVPRHLRREVDIEVVCISQGILHAPSSLFRGLAHLLLALCINNRELHQVALVTRAMAEEGLLTEWSSQIVDVVVFFVEHIEPVFAAFELVFDFAKVQLFSLKAKGENFCFRSIAAEESTTVGSLNQDHSSSVHHAADAHGEWSARPVQTSPSAEI